MKQVERPNTDENKKEINDPFDFTKKGGYKTEEPAPKEVKLKRPENTSEKMPGYIGTIEDMKKGLETVNRRKNGGKLKIEKRPENN